MLFYILLSVSESNPVLESSFSRERCIFSTRFLAGKRFAGSSCILSASHFRGDALFEKLYKKKAKQPAQVTLSNPAVCLSLTAFLLLQSVALSSKPIDSYEGST